MPLLGSKYRPGGRLQQGSGQEGVIWDLMDTKRPIINKAQDMGCTVSGLLVASGTMLRCSVFRIRTWTSLILWRLAGCTNYAYSLGHGGYSSNNARERLPLSAGDKLLVEGVARHARHPGTQASVFECPSCPSCPSYPSAPCWHPNSGGERPEAPKRSSLIGCPCALPPLNKSQ